MNAHSTLSQAMKETMNRLTSRDELLLLDGGTGEELFRRGVPDDRKIWSATALVNTQYQPILRQVHQSFLEAGANAITTNSYGVVPGVGFGMEEIQQYVTIAGSIARHAATEATSTTRTKTPLVLGSMGPLIESYRPDKILPHDEGVAFYVAITEALAPYVDSFLGETMSCVEEAAQAMDAVAHLSDVFSKPMLISFTLDSHGLLRDGESVVDGIRRLLDRALEKNVELWGVLFNCAEPESITKALQNIQSDDHLRTLLKSRGILLGAYANRLTPVASDWSMAESQGPQPFRSDLDPIEYHEKFVSYWVRELDVRIVGGCCGITPEHISHLSTCLCH